MYSLTEILALSLTEIKWDKNRFSDEGIKKIQNETQFIGVKESCSRVYKGLSNKRGITIKTVKSKKL